MAKIGKTINNVIRGDTRVINCTFLQSDGRTAVPLSGGTVYFNVNTLSDPPDDSGSVIKKSFAGGTAQAGSDTFTSGSKGQQQFILSHADTNIPSGTYWYDTQFVDSVGNYLSSYRGQFIVQSDIERL